MTKYSLSLTSRTVMFISPTEIGYTTSSAPQSPISGVTTIWRMSLIDMKPIKVATLKGDAIDVAWSPDGSNVAYLVQTETPSEANRFWLKVGATAPRALTPLIPLYGREGISTDEMVVLFSHDGKYLVTVDTVVTPRYFQVLSVPDGKVAFSPPDPLTGVLTMAVWSHLSDRLYYQSTGVRTWDAATRVVKVVAAGLNWSAPYVSPDDRLVAYESSGAGGKPRVEVRDLTSGSVRVLPGVLGRPILLSDTQMIEVHLVLESTPLGPYYASTRYYTRNLLTNMETLLPAGFQVLDVWPH